MRAFRTAVTIPLGIVTVFVCTLVIGVGAGQLPGEPIKSSGQSVTGAFEGWYENPDGSFSLLVGYFNRNTKQEFDIPVGPNNRVEPGGPDMGQPTHFLTGRQWGVFTIKVPKDFGSKKLSWTIVANGQTNVITMHTKPEWIVEPFEDPASKNTPPVLKFSTDGLGFAGPPMGIAATYTATVGTPLPLTVWATDEGPKLNVPEPSAGRGRGRGRSDAAAAAAAAAGFTPPPPIAVVWSVMRGPGAAVKFDTTKPSIDREHEGKASVTATFAEPGDYILRAQGNDSTGDGGGGFQCCWTNAHVKVTVKPSQPSGQ